MLRAGLEDIPILPRAHEKPRHFGGVSFSACCRMLGMEKSRKHRISKWLVLVIAGPLMLALYVAEYGLMHWMTGKCWLSRDQPALPAAFEPSSVNIQYGLPGGELG